MALINFIPNQFKEGFKQLAEIDNESFKEIKDYLLTTSSKSSVEKLSSNLSLTNSSENDIEEIFSSVGSLMPFIESEEILPEVIDDIVSICELDSIIDKKSIKVFKKRLDFLLNNKQIFYASKAEDLISNYGNKYILSRVISDIRPIFDINLDSTPANGIIIHNLVLHYQSSEEPFHRDITLTLTSENIKSLKEVLDRAEIKEKGLKNIFDKAELKNLES